MRRGASGAVSIHFMFGRVLSLWVRSTRLVCLRALGRAFVRLLLVVAGAPAGVVCSHHYCGKVVEHKELGSR